MPIPPLTVSHTALQKPLASAGTKMPLKFFLLSWHRTCTAWAKHPTNLAGTL